MKKTPPMKKFISLILIAGLAACCAGCAGSFPLTKKVYNDLNAKRTGKWMDEVVFLNCVILPIYGLAAVGDAIVFNTVEFWSDKKPVAEAKAGTVLTSGDLQVTLSYSSKDDTISVVSLKSLKPGMDFTVKRTETGVVAEDQSGVVLYTSVTEADGGISVYDANKILVRHFSPMEIKEVTRRFKDGQG
jgi:galactitol-specific phosphotransferase system IIB component